MKIYREYIVHHVFQSTCSFKQLIFEKQFIQFKLPLLFCQLNLNLSDKFNKFIGLKKIQTKNRFFEVLFYLSKNLNDDFNIELLFLKLNFLQ